jgi:hypothetical protein
VCFLDSGVDEKRRKRKDRVRVRSEGEERERILLAFTPGTIEPATCTKDCAVAVEMSHGGRDTAPERGRHEGRNEGEMLLGGKLSLPFQHG